MRNNQPVTQQEHELQDDDVILSTTDLKGRITYVNKKFIEISGFTEDELIGAAHNIVRHPDMPSAAYEDLWNTIQSGRSWMGIVKNRCKNGDHYWVKSIVTPIYQDGKLVEYQSVRYKVSRTSIARAEKTYQVINKGKLPLVLRLPRVSMFLKSTIYSVLALLPIIIAVMFSGNINWPLLVPATLVSIVVAYFGQKLVYRRMQRMSRYARNIIDNDLLQYIYSGSKDECSLFGVTMNMLETKLKAMSGRAYDSFEHLSAAANDLSNSVALTEQGVNHQSKETRLLNNSLEHMLGAANNVADSAQQAANEAVKAEENATRGCAVVQNTINSINALAGQVEESATVIKQLALDSQAIGAILDVIKGVAEQTNLLALNAAIEAARAGEQGRGFAVVADEVRSLASRTQESTIEIEEMIVRLQQAASSAADTMQSGRTVAQETVTTAAEADNALNAISGSIELIKGMNAQMATAAEEQSSVTQEIKSTIQTFEEISELTSEALQSFKNVQQEMEDSANNLGALVRNFAE